MNLFNLNLALIFFTTLTVSALEPKEIYQKSEPSIVLISSIEGVGSGVIIDSNGLIITNLHVVNTILPLSIKAKVQSSTGFIEKEFKDVEVVKVHKKYDLALIKIKNHDVKFKFLPLSKERVDTASKCYTIGNPIGSNKVLRNTITTGVISSNSRIIEGLKYIQISANINPGNSGGALLDTNGNFIGIVTFKLTDSEGLGFAIPASEIQINDFTKSEKREANIKSAANYGKTANEFFEAAKRSSDRNLRNNYLELSNYLFKMCILENPKDAKSYYNVGLMNRNLERYDLSIAYFEKSLELDPKLSLSYAELGRVSHINGKINKAYNYWHKGLFMFNDNSDVCGFLSTSLMIKQKKYSQGAYLAKLSILLTKNIEQDEQLKLLLKEALSFISEEEKEMLKQKERKEDFSLNELNLLKDLDEKYLSSMIEIKKKLEDFNKNSESIYFNNVSKLLKTSIPLDDWKKRRLPVNVNDAISAYSGIYSILALKRLKKLVIFNNLKGDVEKYISLKSSNYLFCASKSTLLVYYTSTNKIEVIDLNTFKNIREDLISLDYKILNIAMALNESGKAFVSYRLSNSTKRLYGLLDLKNLSVKNICFESRPNKSSDRGLFQVTGLDEKINFSMTSTLKEFCISGSGGYEFVTLNPDTGEHKINNRHRGVFSAEISSNGKFLVNAKGELFDEVEKIKVLQTSMLFRVLESNYFIELNNSFSEFAIYDFLSLSEPIEKYRAPKILESFKYKYGSSINHKIIASLKTNRITVIDKDVIYTKSLLPDKMIKEKLNKKTAKTNEIWNFDLNLPNGYSAKIEDAPEGLTISNGKMNWTVPADYEKGLVEIILVITDSTGKSDFKVFSLEVQ